MHRGETVTEAAVRELTEETGFALPQDALGPIVATSAGLWKGDHDGTPSLGAHSFFFLRVPHPVIDTDGQEEFERSFITGHRWWTLDELRKTTDDIRPPTLVDLLDRPRAGTFPTAPSVSPEADADGLGALSATPSTRNGTCRLRQRHR